MSHFAAPFLSVLFILCSLTHMQVGVADVAPIFPLDRIRFPTPGIVAEQVKFWKKVFYHYPSHTVLIHDTTRPGAVIDIIDFKVWAQKKGLKMPGPYQRQKICNRYTERYQKGIERFAKYGLRAEKFGKIEKRLLDVYRQKRAYLEALLKGQVAIRSQAGLADEFIVAAKRASGYLEFMEHEFLRHQVPPHITRLAFVESMFNLNARSKVGASGIWQFMPSTGKLFLTINRYIDERNSPYLATTAAAKLLRQNYKALKSWPLAITAYNHGRRGIQRAANRVKSQKLDAIIEDHRSPSFKFASKNFYAEFYAAASIYNRLLAEGFIERQRAPNPVVAISIKSPMSLSHILKQAKMTLPQLKKWNPHLRRGLWSRFRSKKLQQKTTVFLPNSKRHLIQKVASLEAHEKYTL
ncbi:MAG: lytic transglycosylase domain-containing protein [Zetaproteobacteria bacterium]|nr:lytic transglycosylase domain-containing protein [Zetaproteobacteria bacterium]